MDTQTASTSEMQHDKRDGYVSEEGQVVWQGVAQQCWGTTTIARGGTHRAINHQMQCHFRI